MSGGFPLGPTGKLIICRGDGKVVLGKSFCPPAISLTLADIVLASCGVGCFGGGGFLWRPKSLAGVNATHAMSLVVYNGIAHYEGSVAGGLVLEKYANALPQCDGAHYIEDVAFDVALDVQLTGQQYDDDECCFWVYALIRALVESPPFGFLFLGAVGGINCATALKVGDTSASLQPCGGTAVVNEL